MQPSLPPPPPPPFPPTPPLPEIPPPEARVAQKVLKETLRLKRGENLVIETWTHTLPLATAFVLEARKIGAHPLVLFEDEATYWKSIEVCSPKDLG